MIIAIGRANPLVPTLDGTVVAIASKGAAVIEMRIIGPNLAPPAQMRVLHEPPLLSPRLAHPRHAPERQSGRPEFVPRPSGGMGHVTVGSRWGCQAAVYSGLSKSPPGPHVQHTHRVAFMIVVVAGLAMLVWAIVAASH